MDLAILGLGVPSMNSGSVKPTLTDNSSQIGRRIGLGGLTGDEGLGGTVKELVRDDGAVSNVLHELLVRGAEVGGGVGLHRSEVVSLGLELSPAAGGAGGDPEHGFVDEVGEGLLPEPGEGGQLHVLGDDLQPLHGTVGEEGVLGVRGRHVDRKAVTIL